MAKSKNYPKIYLWFSSFSKGEHCHSVSLTASDIAEEMTEEMEENLGEVQIEGKTKAERKLNIFGRLNALKPGENDYFEFKDSSWSSISLVDVNSLSNIQKLMGGRRPIMLEFNINGSLKKQTKKQSRKHKK